MIHSKHALTLEDLQGGFSAHAKLEAFAREGTLDFDAIALLFPLYRNQRCTVGHLTQILEYSPSKTSRCLKKLASLSLIEETTENSDLRKCYLRLSRKGLNLVQEMIGLFGETRIFEQIETSTALRHAGKHALHEHLALNGSKVKASLPNASLKILLTLAAQEQPMTVSQLCEAVFLPQSTVSMALKKLKSQGFARCNLTHQDGFEEADLRRRRYQITQRGAALTTALLEELNS